MSSFLQNAKKVDHLASQPSVEGRIQKRKYAAKRTFLMLFGQNMQDYFLKKREKAERRIIKTPRLSVTASSNMKTQT